VASLWFAIFGLLIGMLFALHGPIAWPALCLYIILPTVSAAAAGFIWGSTVLDLSKTKAAADALLRGIKVAAGAFIIFAICFATALPMVEHGWSLHQVPGLLMFSLTLGLLAVGPLLLIAGMVAGVTLYAFGRSNSSQRTGKRRYDRSGDQTDGTE
jgi:hypothetical protein